MKYNHFKLKLRAFIAVLVMFVFGVSANAQQISVSGIVKDAASGEPILGASVIEKGTTKGVITNINGAFTISVASNATLTVKYIGYTTVEMPVVGKRNLIIELKENAVALGEVVAIGYGTVKKKDATGSVTAIKPDKLNKGLTTNAQDMIVGKIAGVNVTTSGGEPGAKATIRIRGGSSLNASNDPLIVIDGLALDNNGIKGVSNFLSTINPNDIETFTVLKDASATAIYGSRASNGVIIINTKKGEKGKKLQVSYDGNASVGIVKQTIDVLNADQFRAYVTDLYSKTQPVVLTRLGTANTNWFDQIFQPALSTDHNLSATGAIKDFPYRVSLGYTDQKGILKTSNFERYTGAISLSPSFFEDHLKVNLNAKGMIAKTRYADAGAIGAAASFDPTQPVTSTAPTYTKFGGYWQWTQNDSKFGVIPNPQGTKNPLATLMQKNDIANSNDVIASAEFDYKVHFLPDLHLHLNLGTENAYGMQNLDVSTAAASDYPFGRQGFEELSKTNNSLNCYALYGKEIGKHRFDVMGGYEWQHFKRESNNEYKGYANSDGIIDDVSFYNPTSSKFATENFLISFFGRANYTFADKYLFTATVRNDRASRFASDNRSALFPSFAFAWKINEEGFMKNTNLFNDLKLRLGYGSTGQQDLVLVQNLDYAYLPVYTANITGAYYPFGNTYYSTSRPDAYNPKLKWEETTTYNAGLDFGILNSRINGSVDYYFRKTKDLINNITAPAGMNFRNKLIQNIGTLQNQGVEFTLNAKPIVTKDLTWDVNYNVTYNQNKITKLTVGSGEGYIAEGDGTFQGYVNGSSVGYPAKSYYVYEQIYGTNGKPIEGLYVDRNGDHKITAADRYFYHNAAPDVTMGLSTKIVYKNFDLGLTLRASIGNYMFNAVAVGGSDVSAGGIYSSLDFLSNKPTSAFDTNFGANSTNFLSDYYIQNASFVRCDNITAGYSFKNLWEVINSGRIYATVQNPFVVTKYKGLDPEVYGGIDNNIYPRPVVTMIGVTLNF
jgi:TonB-dependent starch-binding outer membrane protein SusC